VHGDDCTGAALHFRVACESVARTDHGMKGVRDGKCGEKADNEEEGDIREEADDE
jgi:hypothetical protein